MQNDCNGNIFINFSPQNHFANIINLHKYGNAAYNPKAYNNYFFKRQLLSIISTSLIRKTSIIIILCYY